MADVSGDGKPDLIVANSSSVSGCPCEGSVGVLLGNGDGAFQTVVAYDSGGAQAISVAVDDVNADGKLDIVVANAGFDPLAVWWGNGDGTFQAAIGFCSGGASNSIAAADVNGDGKPDLAVANQSNPGTIGVLINTSTTYNLSSSSMSDATPFTWVPSTFEMSALASSETTNHRGTKCPIKSTPN